MKLNLGSGNKWKEEGWTTLEAGDGYDLNKNLLSGVPNDSVSLIFFSHALEHIKWPSVPLVLEDCYRVLQPSGILRIIVPDVDKLWYILNNNRRDILEEGNPIFYKDPRRKNFSLQVEIQKQIGYLGKGRFLTTEFGHNSFYNHSSLAILLSIAGFKNIYKSGLGESKAEEMRKQAVLGERNMPESGFDNKYVENISLYIECIN